MGHEPYGQKALEETVRRQNAAIAAKEKAEREKREAEQKKNERLRDEFRFWFPTLIALGSLIISIMSILR